MKYHDRRNIISFNQYEHYLISVNFVIVLCYSEWLENLQLVISLFNVQCPGRTLIAYTVKTRNGKIAKLSRSILYIIYDPSSHPFFDKKSSFWKIPPIARFYISQNSINLNDELRVNFSKTRFFIEKRMRLAIFQFLVFTV